jgi:23S rRNA (uracil1939-C5)-methyltransferase
MLESLVAAVLGPDDSAPGAGEEAGDAADLYAGVGLFTLPLAQRHARVHAVESEPAAAEFLAGNAERNRVRNVTVETASVEQAVARLPGGLARIVVDPPRTGLSPPVRSALLALAPRRLTYVSCDVATLARDLKAMAAGFALESLALLDLFPQTSHLEAVAQLRAVGPTPPGSVALG